MTQVAFKQDFTPNTPVLYMAFDLSHKSWKLAFSDGTRTRYCTVVGKDLEALSAAIEKTRQQFQLAADVHIVSCFEAGRDGFWLDRYLRSTGIDNIVVDSSSIEVSRRKRSAKTDRIDAGKLLLMLIRHVGGERKHWGVVRVPGEADEDIRRVQREVDRLVKERGQHTARMRSLLNLHGIVVDKVGGADWSRVVTGLRNWKGAPLGVNLVAELLRENARLSLVREQLLELEREKRRLLEEELEKYPSLRQVKQLLLLKSIGKASSWVFTMEFFGWRQFRNRKQVASLAGLTPTPFSSGDNNREQGISKAGNCRIRSMMIEIAWLWLRYQPESELTLWYQARFAEGGKRMRRIGIVALARRLLIAIWRYLETGEVPKGAVLSAA